jgi:hypothetical protein
MKPRSAFSRPAYDLRIWRTSCEAPQAPPTSRSCRPATRFRQFAGGASQWQRWQDRPYWQRWRSRWRSQPCAAEPARAPPLDYISPATATAGGSPFLLTVEGNDFRHDSGVNWNGSFVVTTFVSTHQLFAAITAADTAQPGTVLVSVFNPPEGSITSVSGAIGAMSTSACSGKNSNAVSFTISP